MRWTNSNVTSAVKDELEDLQSVIDVVSQLPVSTAKRILMYCLTYVEDDNKALPPWQGIKGGVREMAEKFLKEKGFFKDLDKKEESDLPKTEE